jgi:hypothetical protein
MKMKFAAAVAALASTFATSAYAQYTSLAPAKYGIDTAYSASSNYTALYSYSPPFVYSAAHVNAFLINFIDYDFEIVGPANELVPVTLSYNLSAFASGYDAVGFAELQVAAMPGPPNPFGTFQVSACAASGTNSCSSFHPAGPSQNPGSVNLTVESNLAYPIELSSESYADYVGPSYGLPSSAQAFADPVITIDESGYTLELSPGVGNGLVSAAPEPSSWLLMIAGVGLAGLMLRRRVIADPLSRPVAAHV